MASNCGWLNWCLLKRLRYRGSTALETCKAMRAKGRSPTSAIAPPASVGNNKFKGPAISNSHCRDEDVNRASLSPEIRSPLPTGHWADDACLLIGAIVSPANWQNPSVASRLTLDKSNYRYVWSAAEMQAKNEE